MFVVFLEGPIYEFQYPVRIMNENTMTTNFEPHECFIFVQSTKIGINETKANNSKYKFEA